MASFIDLPFELLEMILEPLSRHEISNLSQSCKCLHQCLSPHVYRRIDWHWQDKHPSPPFHLLLRTVITNQQLASHVKILRLRGGGIVLESAWSSGTCEDDGSAWYPDQRARSILDADQQLSAWFKPLELWRIMDVISALDSSRAQEWYVEANRGNVDAILSMILYRCQGLGELDLGFGHIQHSYFLPRMFRRLMDQGRTFAPYPRLKRILLGSDGPNLPNEVFADIDLFRPLLALPQIEYLSAFLLEPPIFTWAPPTSSFQSESLSALILRNTTASESTLESILSRTPKLKHLIYDYYRLVACYPHWECYKELQEQQDLDPNNWYHGRPKVVIRCPLLTKALTHVHNTLETLVLNVQFGSNVRTEIHNNIKRRRQSNYFCHVLGRVRGFEKMHKLKKLETSYILLFGWWENDFEWDDVYGWEYDFPPEDDHGWDWDDDNWDWNADHASDYYDDRDWARSLEVRMQNFRDRYTVRNPLDHDGDSSGRNNPWTGILPQGLERLCLRDDMSDHDHYPHIILPPLLLTQRLLDIRTTGYPLLHRLDFIFVRYPHHYGPNYFVKQLQKLCIDSGLKSDMSWIERSHSCWTAIHRLRRFFTV